MRFLLLLISLAMASSVVAEEQKTFDGLPKNVHAVLEISPEVPQLGEPFYVRLTLENKGDEEIVLPQGYCNHWDSYVFGNFFVLDLDTDISIPFWGVSYSTEYSKFIFAPHSDRNSGETTFLAGKEKRIQYLEESILDRDLGNEKDVWKTFVDDKNAKLRYSSLWAPFDDGISVFETKTGDRLCYYGTTAKFTKYSVSIPVQFSNDSIDELLKIADLKKNKKQIEPEQGPAPHPTGLPLDKKRFSLNDREELVNLYPQGTAKSKEHLLNTWERIQKRGSTDEDVNGLARYLWTLPEMERQYFVTQMLSGISEEKAKGFFQSRKFFFEILRMFPEEYEILWRGKRTNAIKQYQKFQDVSLDELEKEFAEHLRSPIPNDAGKGNEIRGFIE